MCLGSSISGQWGTYLVGEDTEGKADNIGWAVKDFGHPARWVWVWFASWQGAAVVLPKGGNPLEGVKVRRLEREMGVEAASLGLLRLLKYSRSKPGSHDFC